MIREVVHLGKHYAPDFGGIETATQALAEAAHELGHPVTCFTSATRAAPGKTYWLNGVKVQRLWTFGKLLSTPLSPGFFGVKQSPATILHVHLPNPFAELAALLGNLAGRKALLAPYFHALPFRGKGLGGLWFRWVTRPLLQRATVILVSNPALAELFPELREFSAKLRVLPFVTEVSSAESVAEAWAQKEKIVLALGRLVPYKGYADLLQAWSQLQNRAHGYRLVIIGEGPEEKNLRAKAERLGIANSVEFIIGCTESEKYSWFRRASLFAMPSRDESETFGIAALEAMAAGLPLLASDIPTGLATLARGGKCGGQAKAGCADSLASELSKLLQKEAQELGGLGEANRTFAEANFSRAVLVRRYGELVEGLNGSSRAA